MSAVSDFLRDASAAHAAAKAARLQKMPEREKPLLVQAQALRLQAQDADPLHVDPVWQTERVHLHEELLTYYADRLAVLGG